MTDLAPVRPLDVVQLLPAERAELLRVLSDLSPAEWAAPTECPAWSVKGIALHLLGDDLSLLSRQRDGEPPGVVLEAGAGRWDDLFGAFDRFNERWVEAAGFFSSPVLIDLLGLTGEWTHRWYASVDANRPGEAIHWISPEPAPYWLLTAREYLERWIHQLQIRRAVGRPDLNDPRYVVPAVAVTLRGFSRGLARLPAPGGTTLTYNVAENFWTLRRETKEWSLLEGAPSKPTVRLTLDVDTAAALFSRGLAREEVQERVQAEGDPQLTDILVSGLAGFFGREEEVPA
ncbi:MAG: maleylpyruvate isomerase family mycothiol-dependent enzyme [Actinomycetota bacterium]